MAKKLGIALDGGGAISNGKITEEDEEKALEHVQKVINENRKLM